MGKSVLEFMHREIAEAYKADFTMTITRVAEHFGVSVSTAERAIRLHGIDAQSRYLNRIKSAARERAEAMAARLAEGVPAKRVAAEFGTTRASVYTTARKAGGRCTPANRKRKAALLAKIRRMRRQGMRYPQIAAELHYSSKYLRELEYLASDPKRRAKVRQRHAEAYRRKRSSD